jgi:hypothetical protein
MAGQNQVSVDIQAQIEGYKAALAQAASSTNEFASKIKGSLDSLASPFERIGTTLAGIAAVAGGGYLFKDMVATTVSLTGETKKLAMTFGLSLSQASDLRTELQLAGVTSDEYTAAAMKLDRQVRTNGDTLQRHGLVIKDSNGKLLDQQTLMQNAISYLGQFEAGTARNMAAQALFGKNVGDTNNLMKLNAEMMERARKANDQLGLATTSQDVKEVREYNIAMQDLKLTFAGIEKAIGSAVLPYLTQFAEWFREQGPFIILAMRDLTRSVINGAIDIAESVVRLIGSFDDMKASAMGAFHATAAVFLASTSQIRLAFEQAKLAYKDFTTASSGNVDTAITKWEELRKRLLTPVKITLTDIHNVVYAKTLRTDPPGTAKDDKQADQIAKARIERAKMVDDIELENEDRKNKDRLARGEITNAEYLRGRLELQQRINDVNEDAADAELRLTRAGTVERERAATALVKAQKTAAQSIDEINRQIAADQRKTVGNAIDSIENAWNSQLEGVLAKTTSWADAMRNISRTLAMEMIKWAQHWAFEKIKIMVTDAIFGKAKKTEEVVTHEIAEEAKTASTVAGVVERTTAEEAGSATSIATKIGETIVAIQADIAKVFSGITAALSEALGPAAPIVALGIAGGVGALALSKLPSRAVGDWRVPRDMAVNVHEGEMIVPQQGGYANAMRAAMAAGGGGGGRGGDVHFTVQAVDSQSVERLLSKNGRHLAKVIAENFKLNPTLRPKY